MVGQGSQLRPFVFLFARDALRFAQYAFIRWLTALLAAELIRRRRRRGAVAGVELPERPFESVAAPRAPRIAAIWSSIRVRWPSNWRRALRSVAITLTGIVGL